MVCMGSLTVNIEALKNSTCKPNGRDEPLILNTLSNLFLIDTWQVSTCQTLLILFIRVSKGPATRVPGFYLHFSIYGGGKGKLLSEWAVARIEATKFLHVWYELHVGIFCRN